MNKPNHTYLTGSYTLRIDGKKRIRLPKQLMDPLITLTGKGRRLYLKNDNDKILAYTLSAVQKMRNELVDLPLIKNKTQRQMEELGSTLNEIVIDGDQRILIPDEMLLSLGITNNDEVTIKGAFEFITITKKAQALAK